MHFSSPRLVLGRSLRARSTPEAWNIRIATYTTSHVRRHDHRVEASARQVVPTTTVTATPPSPTEPAIGNEATNQKKDINANSSLAILPLSAIIRSLAITTLTSVPALLGPALAALSVLANSKSAMLNPDKNKLLKAILRNTIYSQFCAGETPAEVQRTISGLKQLGYAGVILGYAKEVVMDDAEETSMLESRVSENGKGSVGLANQADAELCLREIREWKDGTLQTLDLAEEGDFVALKFTGAGRQALRHLVHGLSPSPDLEKAISEICDRARDRKILLLFDAEQHAVQDTIDSWVLQLQRRYNGTFSINGKPRALIYNTHQAYLRSTPQTLAKHLAISQRESFVLGVKLVRGAYLNSDPRHLFWPTKRATDNAYDSIARCLINRTYDHFIRPENEASSAFSGDKDTTSFQADLVLASHNRASVEKARALRNEQIQRGEPLTQMVYGQLQGMADDISCQLVSQSAARTSTMTSSAGAGGTLQGKAEAEVPRPYKYLVWGTVGECTKYLLRRGHENRDAASRTKDTRIAMWNELKRRSSMGW